MDCTTFQSEVLKVIEAIWGIQAYTKKERNVVVVHRLDLVGSGPCAVAGPCEDGNDGAGSKKCWEILYHLSFLKRTLLWN